LNHSLADDKAKLREILAEIQAIAPEVKEGEEAPVLSPSDAAKSRHTD
jgi:hypothetical protein